LQVAEIESVWVGIRLQGVGQPSRLKGNSNPIHAKYASQLAKADFTNGKKSCCKVVSTSSAWPFAGPPEERFRETAVGTRIASYFFGDDVSIWLLE
jgi:hypothetical protein